MSQANGLAQRQYQTGDYTSAISTWKSARVRESMPQLDYYEGRLYLDELANMYSEAWALIEMGDPAAGKKAYQFAAEELAQTYSSRDEFLRNRSDDLSDRNIFFQIYSGYLTQGFLNNPQSRLMRTLQEVEPVPLPIVKIDKTFPAAFKNSTLEQTAFRVVALPVIEPLTSIGRLFNGKGTCTASLVAPAIAITNAHCVTEKIDKNSETDWVPRRGMDPKKMLVSFNHALYAPDMVNVIGFETHNSTDWDGSVENDWAILFLDRHPVGRGHLGWLADTSASFPNQLETRIMIAGHSSDLNKGDYITMDYGCSAFRSDLILYYQCETAPGSSGAPILLVDGKFRHYYLVGLHNLGFREIVRQSGGIHISSFVHALKRAVEGANATN